MPLIRTIFSPLGINALEKGLPPDCETTTTLALLASLFEELKTPVQEVVRRYREVTDQSDEPYLVPMHDVIMKHVIRPLAEAKRCYFLCMPVACIAQAGLVGEMIALWRFRMIREEMAILPEEKRIVIPTLQEFDKLGQVQRVTMLREIEPMDADVVSAFGELRGIRRDYMHFMVGEKKNPDRDALRAMKFATLLVVKTLGLEISEGMIVLPPRVNHFIRDMVQRDESEPL